MRKFLIGILILVASVSYGQRLITGVVSAGVGSSPPDTVPVILVIGQSNALGQPGIPVLQDLPVAYQGEQTNINIWWEGDYQTVDTVSGSFVNMNPVENTRHPDYTDPLNAFYNRAGWSVEQRCSHYLLDDYDNVYVIKSAYGGKTISAWASPSGERWVELERYVRKGIAWMEANNHVPNFIGAVWLQGESDISGATAQATYESDLTTFISNLRGLSSYMTNMDFYMSKIPTDYWGDESICNTSFANIAGSDSYSFILETTQYSAGYDSTDAGHYIGQNLLDLGADWYDAMTHGIPTKTNLELYYAARYVEDSSDYVASFYDASGNKRNGSQATNTSRPSIVSSDVGNYNALLFDGTDDWINSADFAVAAPYTIYLIATTENGANGDAMVGNSSGGNMAAFWVNGSTNLSAYLGSVNDIFSGFSTQTIYQSCFISGGSSYSLIGTTSDTDANGSRALNGICVGRYANGNTYCMNGKFYELLIYSGAHNEATRNSVLSYLESKYGL